ncbi:MAPEG family protein [Usitatibacter palustris]|uniref:MAPEG family protein n=1 Tax=Usitatibacter palustris TaxID=2732487 RepID=A0A6M4H333_9PROT|nr:MAPEG family protein [Usitatibacter palustris]QJR13991.1 hypothetical protein DSM104440_00783 [Usitatibacter palustris]
MTASTQLVAACLAMVLLVFVVGLRMFRSRIGEMVAHRIRPHEVATSVMAAAKYQDVRAADNFRNLFEVPVLFFALVAIALATKHTPGWLVAGAWLFVALRFAHSYIHCTYNKVRHRFYVFATALTVVMVLWVAFFVTLPA